MVATKISERPTRHLKSKGDNMKKKEIFNYLGEPLSTNGKCPHEIKTRVLIAKDTSCQLKEFTNKKNISVVRKDKNCETVYGLSVLLYG